MKYDKLIRSLSAFGCFVCLYFILDAFFGIGDCAKCTIVHSNFNVHPAILGSIGICTFMFYFLSTKLNALQKWIPIVSIFVLIAEALLLSLQAVIFKIYCLPCVAIGIIFIVILCILHRSQPIKILIGLGLSVLIAGTLHLTQFKNLSQFAPFLSAMIVENTEDQKFLVIQSSCNHCEVLLEKLEEKKLLNTVNILSLDKPTSVVSKTNTAKDRVYNKANWSEYSNLGLYNFLGAFSIKGTPILFEVPNMNTILVYYGAEEILEHITSTAQNN